MLWWWWWCYSDDDDMVMMLWWWWCAIWADNMIMVMIILRRGSDFSRNENSFKTWIYLIVEFCCKREDISFLFCILFKTFLLFMVEHWFGWALGWWDRGEVEGGCSHLDLRSHSWYIVWNTQCNFVLRSIWYLFIELNISFSTYLYYVYYLHYLYLFVLLLVTLVPCHAFSTWNLDLQKS